MKEFSEFKIINHLDVMQKILNGENTPPITVEIDPTNECNHQCIWCIDAKHRLNHFSQMDKDVLFAALKDMARMGVQGIVIKGGGEPLVYPHIAQLLEYIHSLGLKVGIITNGELIGKYSDVILSTCDWLRVSIDAGTLSTHERVHRPKNTGAFNRIIDNIQDVAGRIFTGMIYVVHPFNANEMAKVAEVAKSAGCHYIAFKKVILPNRNIFSPELLLNIDSSYIYAKKSLEDDRFKVIGFRIYDFTNNGISQPYQICKAHQLIGIVCADQKLYACCSTRGKEDYCFGSFEEQSFEQIWNSERRKEVLERIDSGQCRQICVGKTSYMRYDHYNKLAEYLNSSKNAHTSFL